MKQVLEEINWAESASAEDLRRGVQALYHIHRLIPAMTDLDTLLTRIMEEGRRTANAEASSLMLYEPEANELYFHVALGESSHEQVLKHEIRLKLGEGVAGAAAAERRSISVSDAQSDSRFSRRADAATTFTTRSLLAVPMLDRGELVGVLELVNKEGGGSFSATDARLMEMFSTLAASAIANARLFEARLRNERLAAIGQAVTGLSHYTKNIVTGLSNSVELIEMGLEAGNLDILRRSFPVFKRCTRRISHFVQDMLSFSKARKPMRRQHRLSATIQDAIETFEEFLNARQIAVQVQVAWDEPVWVENEAIHRCLLNLLLNAADAMAGGEGTITVIQDQPEPALARIRVRDTGPGVPSDIRDSIFDPFFSTKGSKGTGLGLAVTRKAVEEHGGQIGVGDAPGGGAEFWIILPQGIQKH